MTASGQPFSPMMPLGPTASLSSSWMGGLAIESGTPFQLEAAADVQLERSCVALLHAKEARKTINTMEIWNRAISGLKFKVSDSVGLFAKVCGMSFLPIIP